jgi:hypothetical protein
LLDEHVNPGKSHLSGKYIGQASTPNQAKEIRTDIVAIPIPMAGNFRLPFSVPCFRMLIIPRIMVTRLISKGKYTRPHLRKKAERRDINPIIAVAIA